MKFGAEKQALFQCVKFFSNQCIVELLNDEFGTRNVRSAKKRAVIVRLPQFGA